MENMMICGVLQKYSHDDSIKTAVNGLNRRARMSLSNVSEQFACAGLNMANAKAIVQKA